LEEALSPPPFTMVDGGASTIEGAFVALPQKTFALDYKGAAFNDLLRDVSTPALSGVNLSFSVHHEPGAPEPADGAFGPLLNFAVFPRPAYVDKVCNPENEDDEGQRVCDDAAACPAGCNDQKALTLPGDHAREYAYGNPFAGGQELASVNYSFRANFGEGVTSSTGPNQLRGGFFVIAPAAELNGAPLAPVVGLARNVTFNGQPAPVGALTPGVGLTPAIAFEPPTLGTPSSYRVIVNQVVLDRSNAGTEFAYGVSIANVTLDGTALTLPAGILEAGTTYYLQVEARVREPLPSKSPFRTGPHFASSTTFTGAFTP
ncbi:MAG: hypothetical protein MUF34_27770, partial [Polyangiaceae bacterium]|nr:hypothetical protein [Polyangiaceae bacterium]